LYNRLRWTEREGKEGRTDSGETKGVLFSAFENLDHRKRRSAISLSSTELLTHFKLEASRDVFKMYWASFNKHNADHSCKFLDQKKKKAQQIISY
jgi:hypothetical protein